MKRELEDLTIELATGDIVNQPDCDAIVNAANAQLRIGGGVAGAIHRKGDPELERETRKFAPISPGEAVITKAPNLPNKYVIHCLGPVYGRDKPEDKLLADCHRNALKRADEYGINSIAFPALSTGAFGFPVEPAANIAINTVAKEGLLIESLKLVRFVLWSRSDYEVHKNVLENLSVSS
ncbi:MAG: macro domain-containing protein [Balneolaceae bacterium]